MKVEATTTETIQVISFSLINESNKKKENYAVPIEQIREIRPFENITKVPKSKPFVKGIMNLRGMIIPIIDVKKRLGFGEIKDLDKNYRILVADVRDSVYGLIVDNVDKVLHISPNDVEPIPPENFNSQNYIRGIAKIDNKLIVLLDIIALLEEEQETNDDIKKEIDEIPLVENNQTIDSIPNENNSEEDEIPDALKEVFAEDERKNPPQAESS